MSIFTENCHVCGKEMRNGYLWGIRGRHDDNNVPPICKQCRQKYKKMNSSVRGCKK